MSHSGNWNKNPAKLALERARIAASFAHDPPGFYLDGDEWRGIKSPAASLLRGAVIKGRCQTPECSRRVTLDLRWWVDHGLGDLNIFYDIEPTYRCARLRCRFAFDPETYPNGFPLLLGMKQGASVRVSCEQCRWSTVVEAMHFLKQITEAGIGTACSTPEQIAKGLRKPCRQCGYVRWYVGRVALTALTDGTSGIMS